MATTLPPTPPFEGLPQSTTPAAAPAFRDAPGQRSPATERMDAVMQPLRDLLGGITTLRARGEDYLPRLTGESDADFQRRLELAGFFNTYRRAVKSMAGMITRHDPALQDDSADVARLRDHWEAIDDEGNHGAVFARRLCEEAVATGFAGILVDMPSVPSDARVSAADAERLNLRPYWVPVTREQIVDAEWALVGARRVCVYLELHERDERRARDGRFGRETVDRYRVYTRDVMRDGPTDRVLSVGPPMVQVWEQVGTDRATARTPAPVPLRARGGKPMSAIPFSACVGGDLIALDGGWEVDPPLQPLADLCFVWYQVFAERRNVTNRVCSPTLWLAGYVPELDQTGKPKPLDIGASRAILVSENGKVGYAAPSGDGFQPTKDDLTMLSTMMASVAMAFLMAETRAAETAEGKRIDAEAQNSGLSAIARALQDALELAMEYHAEFDGIEACSIEVNRDFETVTADPQLIDALSKLVDGPNPKMTLERFLTFLDRMLRDGVDREQELADLERLTPPPPAPGTPGVAGATTGSGDVLGRISQALAQATTAPTPAPAAPTPDVAAAAA